MRINAIFPFLFLAAMTLLSGCQLSQQGLKSFEKVKPGMEKPEVLDIVGSPDRRQRWHGMDRWTYIYFEKDRREEKEIHFDEGKATYVGARVAPEISAEEQDTMNDDANRAVQARAAEQRNSPTRIIIDNEMLQGVDSQSTPPQFDPVR